jgi:hypothetical protein
VPLDCQGYTGTQEMEEEFFEHARLQVSQPQTKMLIQIFPLFSHLLLAI